MTVETKDEKTELESKDSMISDELESMYEDLYSNPWGYMSFRDFKPVDKTGDIIEDLQMLHSISSMLLYNVNEMSPNKLQDAKQIVADYTKLADTILNQTVEAEDPGLVGNLKAKVKEWTSALFTKARKFKTEAGKKFYSSDYLYVPDPEKPSTWKLRVAEGESGNVTVAQLGRAAAAFSSGGFRGNKVQLPGGSAGGIKKKLRGLYKKLGVADADIPDSIKEAPLMIWKDQNGKYRWLARYSNNYRDDDRPREIIAKQSHERFVEMVDSGKAPYPELWHWHEKSTKWGQADWVAYDSEYGIAMAAGYVLKGHEKEAEALAELDIPVGVSHGMPRTSVVKDLHDNTVIVEHITREISDLPLSAAANKLTSFEVFKENEDMAIPERKKEYLKALGLDVKEIEEGNAAVAEHAKELELESKETPSAPVQETPAETPPVETPPIKPTEEDAGKKEEKDLSYVTSEQLAEVVGTITDAISDAIKSLKADIEAIKVEKEQAPSPVPTASLAAMIGAKFQSAIGADSTKVSKRENLSKSGPEETPASDAQNLVNTGNPVIDQTLTSILRR